MLKGEKTMQEHEQFLQLLDSWRFSAYLDDESKRGLSDAASLVRYGKGETIIKQDQVGQIFWIIAGGSASAKTKDRKGEDLVYQKMGPGDFFGEISLLFSMPRTADVVADEEILLYMVGREDFERFLISNADVEKEIREFARKRLEITAKMAQGAHEEGDLFGRLKHLFMKKK